MVLDLLLKLGALEVLKNNFDVVTDIAKTERQMQKFVWMYYKYSSEAIHGFSSGLEMHLISYSYKIGGKKITISVNSQLCD